MALRFVSSPDSSDKEAKNSQVKKINHDFFVEAGQDQTSQIHLDVVNQRLVSIFASSVAKDKLAS